MFYLIMAMGILVFLTGMISYVLFFSAFAVAFFYFFTIGLNYSLLMFCGLLTKAFISFVFYIIFCKALMSLVTYDDNKKSRFFYFKKPK